MSFFRVAIAVILLCPSAAAQDWPTYRHDNNRSGATSASLPFPLAESWRYQARQSPERAWDGPNPNDYWQRIEDVKPRMTFDRAYHASIVDGRLYFASSADDSVVCLDAATGEERWVFVAGGPVRLSPTIYQDQVYFGCDDGFVYCLNAASGEMRWQYSPIDTPRIVPGNQRLISPWAVRTGVVIEDDILYFAAGLFPEDGVYLCAVRPDSGEEQWKQPLAVSPQGFMLSSSTRLYAPTGRAAPAVFERETGEYLHSLGGGGGAYALLTDDRLFYGPGRYGRIDEASADTNDWFTSFPGDRIIVTSTHSFLQANGRLSAIDRARYRKLTAEQKALTQQQRGLTQQAKPLDPNNDVDKLGDIQTQMREVKQKLSIVEKGVADCVLWDVECSLADDLVLTNDALVAGGDGEVAAFEVATGKQIWQSEIQGRAYGLSAANGQLFVSTDQGFIHAFGKNANEPVDASPKIVANNSNGSPGKSDAETILNFLNRDQGYALILSESVNEWIGAFQPTPNLHLAGAVKKYGLVQQVRNRLVQQGDYGSRASIHHIDSNEMPFTNYLFNLIVCDDACAITTDSSLRDLMRLVRPHGGVLAFKSAGVNGNELIQRIQSLSTDFVVEDTHTDGDWVFIRRGGLPGEGQWTHPFSNPGNSANSGDKRVRGELQVQWFGRPGPDRLIDRHHRGTPPLSLNGVGVLYGNEVLTAFDAYNGTHLWEREVPHTLRVGIPYDAGNLAMNESAVYLLSNETCQRYDIQSGERLADFTAPQLDNVKRHWGYLSVTNELVLGGAQEIAAERNQLSRADITEQYGEFRPVPLAQSLFALDAKTGKPQWTYQNGLIPNISIAADKKHVYFVESRNPEALLSDQTRLQLDALLNQNAYLVALDIKTGKPVWQNPVDLTDCQHVFYLSATDNVITIVGSRNRKDQNSVWYYVYAFDAANGELMWRRDHANTRPGLGGNHAEQVHHPVLMDGLIVAEPRAYHLETGEPYAAPGSETPWIMSQGRSGCGTISGSEYCVYYRNGNPMIHDLSTSEGEQRISSVNRTGCWINVIAAGGLLLMPEASSGCTCNYSIQTSIGFIPVSDSMN